MHDAVVSKLIAASRGSPCDSMASCLCCYWPGQNSLGGEVPKFGEVSRKRHQAKTLNLCSSNWRHRDPHCSATLRALCAANKPLILDCHWAKPND